MAYATLLLVRHLHEVNRTQRTSQLPKEFELSSTERRAGKWQRLKITRQLHTGEEMVEKQCAEPNEWPMVVTEFVPC